MKIEIQIECDTIQELFAHLSCLQQQVIKQAKVNKQDITRDDFAPGTELSDNNCYGVHLLIVYEEHPITKNKNQ